MQLRALMIVNPEVAFFTRVDMTIDYNQMFDSDIIIDLEILIDVVLCRLTDGNQLGE